MLRLARTFGSPEQAVRASVDDLRERANLSLEQALKLRTISEKPEPVRSKLDAWREEGISLVCIEDSGYPRMLLSLKTPPPLLYLKGAIGESDARAVAVVGTRGPDRDGQEFAKWFARGLAGRGFVVVSGLARGIDTAGHWGAMEVEQGRTIAILGSGLLRIYPPENRTLANRIIDRGALIAEVPPDAHVHREYLLARDRIQAGLSRAVIVVQAGVDCGSIVTARAAVQCKRRLYGVEWQTGAFHDGWEQLRSMGARAIAQDTDLDALAAEIETVSEEASQSPLL